MKKAFFLLAYLFLSLFSVAQPIAGFTKSAVTGCVNSVLVLTSTATGGVVEHFWEFGDGATSAEINPSHTYSIAGSKTITLTVTDGDGLTDVYSSVYFVSPPVADFSFTPGFSCGAPSTVSFTDASYFPDTWSWNFGDGTTSTLKNPSHTYTYGGSFLVTLTVLDTNHGCVDSYTETIQISEPIAEIGGPASYFECGPLTVNFENASTNLGPGTIVEWLWDFGDGTTSVEEVPTHVYDEPGSYDVTLTITNDLGCSSINSTTDYVTVIGPNVDFEADVFFAECTDLTVDFTNSTSSGAPITSWDWNFGDGGSSDLENPTHTYTDYGVFDVSLTVSDLDGCARTLTFEEYINVQDVEAPTFDACPSDQLEELSATCDFELPDYTALATISDNCDGLLTLTQSPSVGTIISADQLIILTLIDEAGNTNTCSFNVYLEDNINPVLTCPGDQLVSFDSDCAYMLLDYTGMATATDNCLSPTVTQSPVAGTIITGLQTITITAIDTAGNTVTCNFDVIPSDDTAPTITCPASFTSNNDPGECSALLTYTTPVGLDNCSATTTLTAGLASGSFFPVGTTTNTYSVTDGVGLTASCSFDITVIDAEAPVLVCPSPISKNNDAGLCGAIITFSAPDFSDNCPGGMLSQVSGLASGELFPIGTTTNSFEGVDASGNTVTCSFDVTITDTENPTIDCPANSESCEAIIDYDSPVVNDNCGLDSWNLTAGLDSGSEFPLGVTTNTYEVSDIYGNIAWCSFTVTRFEVPVVNAGEDQLIDAGFSIQLDGSSSLPGTYSWSPPDDLDDANLEDPTAKPKQSTLYTVTVTTTDGCSASDEVQINVALVIEINNFMSPNGDGKNDTWEIKGNYLLDACTIKILDSWGNVIYESLGYDNGWNGTIEGEELQQGVYYYILDCGDGSPQTGSITLIR